MLEKKKDKNLDLIDHHNNSAKQVETRRQCKRKKTKPNQNQQHHKQKHTKPPHMVSRAHFP